MTYYFITSKTTNWNNHTLSIVVNEVLIVVNEVSIIVNEVSIIVNEVLIIVNEVNEVYINYNVFLNK